MPKKKVIPTEELEQLNSTEYLQDAVTGVGDNGEEISVPADDSLPAEFAVSGGMVDSQWDSPAFVGEDQPQTQSMDKNDIPAVLEEERTEDAVISDADGSTETSGGTSQFDVVGGDLEMPVEAPAVEGPADAQDETVDQSEPRDPRGDLEEDTVQKPERTARDDRQEFFDLDFHELDRGLTPEEQQEWNSIYASFRGRSALTGRIIGVDPHSINVLNRETGKMERQTMYCAIVIPFRVRVVIPATEMWEQGHERPDFVLQNMVGAEVDFIIVKVDREAGFAIGSRRLAARAQRYFFAHRANLHRQGTRIQCRVLSVGPRRCLVECFGHDINLTQRELRYSAIPDLRREYHPGQMLDCVVKGYAPDADALQISVKETQSNPFDGAQVRHPVGSRRQAVIAGKYGGGVFCNLPDGTVCMCNYSYQHEDSDFMVGDTVIVVVQRFEMEKKQMYGKILTKW